MPKHTLPFRYAFVVLLVTGHSATLVSHDKEKYASFAQKSRYCVAEGPNHDVLIPERDGFRKIVSKLQGLDKILLNSAMACSSSVC